MGSSAAYANTRSGKLYALFEDETYKIFGRKGRVAIHCGRGYSVIDQRESEKQGPEDNAWICGSERDRQHSCLKEGLLPEGLSRGSGACRVHQKNYVMNEKFMWAKEKMVRMVWRRILAEYPELVGILENEALLAEARSKHPRLDSAIRNFGMPAEDLLSEIQNGGGTLRRQMTFNSSAVLSLEELRQFYGEGFVHCRGIVSQELVESALRHVNASLGTGTNVDRSLPIIVGLKQGNAAPLLNLFYNSNLPTLVQSLLGKGKARPPNFAQVALRFPAHSDPRNAAAELRNGRAWHVDGFGKGEHSPFTLLVGVCLSDVQAPLAGSFAVHPGAHWTLQNQVKALVERDDSEVFSRNFETSAKPNLGPPTPVLMKTGDVVLAHQKLPHLGMSNYSSAIRYQVYFRIQHVEIEKHRHAWLDDVLLPFEGLRETFPA